MENVEFWKNYLISSHSYPKRFLYTKYQKIKFFHEMFLAGLSLLEAVISNFEFWKSLEEFGRVWKSRVRFWKSRVSFQHSVFCFQVTEIDLVTCQLGI